MRGASRQGLLESLRCGGSLEVRDAAWRGVALGESLAARALVKGSSTFRDASADYACGAQAIELRNIELAGADERISGGGSVDFGRNLNLQLRIAPEAGRSALGNGAGSAVPVTGTPAAPSFAPVTISRRAR